MGMRWQRHAWHDGNNVAMNRSVKRRNNLDVDVFVVASTNSGLDMAVGLDLKITSARVQI